MRLSTEDLQFLSRFARTDGPRLLLILRAKLAERDRELRDAVGENVFRAQGRAKELDELISMIESAGDTLKRTEASRQRSAPPAP